MNHNTPGLPVHHQLSESTQTHVHRVSDLIQPSHPLSSPSPPALSLSQQQGLSQWLGYLHQVGQNIRASASASVVLMNSQGWFPFGLTGLILQSKSLLRVFSSTTVQKHQFFGAQPSLWYNSLIHTWPTGKTIALTRWTFVGKMMSLLFNTLARFVIAILPRSKNLLILWLQSLSTVILESKKMKSDTVSTFLHQDWMP